MDYKNNLFPRNFNVTIGADIFKNTEYYCTYITLPSISLTSIDQKFNSETLRIAGEGINYEPFSMTFLLNEDMTNYLEMFNWMRRIQYERIEVYDIVLLALDNRGQSNKKITFRNAFPTNLSEIEMDTKSEDIAPLFCTCSFAFTDFQIV